jgi:hypothetical protein
MMKITRARCKRWKSEWSIRRRSAKQLLLRKRSLVTPRKKRNKCRRKSRRKKWGMKTHRKRKR